MFQQWMFIILAWWLLIIVLLLSTRQRIKIILRVKIILRINILLLLRFIWIIICNCWWGVLSTVFLARLLRLLWADNVLVAWWALGLVILRWRNLLAVIRKVILVCIARTGSLVTHHLSCLLLLIIAVRWEKCSTYLITLCLFTAVVFGLLLLLLVSEFFVFLVSFNFSFSRFIKISRLPWLLWEVVLNGHRLR